MRSRWLVGVLLVVVACGGGSVAATTSTTVAPVPVIEGSISVGTSIFSIDGSFAGILDVGLVLSDGMECIVSDGFSDIEAGVRVVVNSEEGTIIGAAPVESGVYVLNQFYVDEGVESYTVPAEEGYEFIEKVDARSFVDSRGDCMFPFVIELSDEAEFYSLTVGGGERGELVYSHAEMVGQDWVVSLSLS